MSQPVGEGWLLGREAERRRGEGMRRLTRKRKSKIHGWGLFAYEALKKNTCIGEYTGKIVPAVACDDGTDCCFRIHCIDFALNSKETIRGTGHLIFVNHSLRPNCVARTHRRRIHFYTTRSVAAGRELTINYHCDCKKCKKK